MNHLGALFMQMLCMNMSNDVCLWCESCCIDAIYGEACCDSVVSLVVSGCDDDADLAVCADAGALATGDCRDFVSGGESIGVCSRIPITCLFYEL